MLLSKSSKRWSTFISSSECRQMVAMTFWMSFAVLVRYIPIFFGGMRVCSRR